MSFFELFQPELKYVREEKGKAEDAGLEAISRRRSAARH